jgi:glucose-6-phosphate 1-epimerase
MSIVTIVHSHSGASAQVHTFGATVVAFTNSKGREVLFLSRDAKVDGSKAIRGGIPLVFPQFGATPDTTMPQHGFARCNSWNVQDSYDNEESAGMTFTLDWKDVTQGKGDGAWSNGTFDCTLKLHVQVQASSLTTTLTIQNKGSMSFDFQTLFHTYFLVQQHQALKADQCHVIGLEGYQCEDKISGDTYTCSSQPIIIDSNIDHIYTPPEGKLDVQITVKTGNETFATMDAFGFVNGQKVPTSCVVWK